MDCDVFIEVEEFYGNLVLVVVYGYDVVEMFVFEEDGVIGIGIYGVDFCFVCCFDGWVDCIDFLVIECVVFVVVRV